MSHLWGIPALVLIVALLVAGCGNDDDFPPASDVAGVVPWPDSESLDYVLKDKKGEVVGRGTLSVDVENGTTRLIQSYVSDSGTTDEITVIVDSVTLKPTASSREIVTADDSEQIEVTYTDEGALIRQGDKQSGLSVPEHAFDNDSSLFLWRTLPFAIGYEASYVTIITNRRGRQDVRLRVVAREVVRVPAGEFEAWRLEIKTSNAEQFAWFADTPTRPLVRYNNDRGLFFELEAPP